MIYERRPPAPHLQSLINCYWLIDSEGDAQIEKQKIVPDGYNEIILTLIEHEVSISQKCKAGNTPLHTAIRFVLLLVTYDPISLQFVSFFLFTVAAAVSSGDAEEEVTSENTSAPSLRRINVIYIKRKAVTT